MEKSFTVATFNEAAPAEALAARLREGGFDADLFDESAAQKWILLNVEPRAHMRVRVPGEQGEKALVTLKEWDQNEGLLKNAVQCPQCHSSRVEYPQFSRKTFMSALPAAAAAVGLIEREYFCEACGFTWEAEPKPEPERDVLGWEKDSAV